MTCLAPIALLGLVLLILPIVVHLFKPRKMKQTPFSSLRWLKETHQRLSRRIQWHQWLLFLLRAGCIVLLVFALAKPLIGFWGSRSVDRFIIVDVSRSMAYQTPDTPSSMERATDLAGRMAQANRVGDRTSVILAGASPQLIAAPGSDASSAVAAIQSLRPGPADARLSATLPLVRSLLPTQGTRDVELIFVTDNLAERWRQQEVQSFLKDLPNPVRVNVIECGANPAANGWITGARLFQFGADEDRWIRVLVGCNAEPNQARSVRLTGIEGRTDETQLVGLKPGQLTAVDFRIPANVSLQGQVAELRLEPADALASDDVYFLALDNAARLRVIVVESDTPGPDGRSVGLYLRVGMEVLSTSKNQALEVTTRTASNVAASDFAKADVIFLAGVARLTDGVLESLESRVRSGAGLGIFLGPQVQPAFYNQKLYRPQQPAEGLLPLPIKVAGETFTLEGRPGALTNVRWTHPLLALLQDPVLSDLPRSRFRMFANLAGTPARTDVILARFDDETPAIVDRPMGAGRVLVFNTSANDEWSDLPNQKRAFLPLLDRALSHLSAGGIKRSFTLGEPVTLALADHEPNSPLKVTTPSGAKLTPRRIVVRGQTLLHIDEVAETGAYPVEGAGAITFTVNASRTDSPLAAMDAAVLAEWWAPASLDVVSADAAREQLGRQWSHWPVWPALVLLAGLLLIAETIYVHRLCPRANPKTAEAVVPQRGMMKPMAESSV